MKEIDRQAGGWILFELPPHRLVLSVNCGTVASYDTNIELDPDEREEYMIAGRVFIEMLADKITSRPSSFRKRHVELPENPS